MASSPSLSAADLASRLARLQTLVLNAPREAEAELLQVLDMARQIESEPQEAAALIYLSGASFHQGYYRKMLGYAQEALAVSRRAHVPLSEARALNNVGLAYQRLGLFDQAIPLFLEGLRLSQQHLDHEGICRALTHIALAHNSLGEYERALELHREVLPLARGCGNSVFVAEALCSIAEDHRLLGAYQEALSLGTEALAFAQEKGLTRYECSSHRVVAFALFALGRNEAAYQAAQLGLQVAERFGDDEERAEILQLCGQVLMALGRFEEAEKALLLSLSLCSEVGNSLCERDLRTVLADFYAAQGDHAAAYAHLNARLELDQRLRDQEQRVRAMEWSLQSATEQARQLSALTSGTREAALLWSSPPTEALSGLVGRPLLQTRLHRALERLGPQQWLGLLQIDVDRMCEVNEQYGQSVGDSVLSAIGSRLSGLLRPGDLAARVGGDKFMLLLPHLAQSDDLALVMDRVLSELHRPFEVRGQHVRVSVSVGGTVASQDGQTLEALFRHAELATKWVKRQGGQGVARFTAEMGAEEDSRRQLARDLHAALTEGQLVLHYQGEFALPGSELRGAEALMRWQHPQRGLLFPAEFIPVAEEHNLIADLGDWALDEACRQAAEWRFGERGMCVGVNVSAVQFEQPNFAERVKEVLKTHCLSGSALMLELTETMLYRDEKRALRHIEDLQALGVRIALDDFGTGYSSLSLLHKVKFQVLKLDRSFLPDVSKPKATYERTCRLLEVVVQLANSLDMTLIVEGVEQAGQLDLIAQLGGQQVQGYWLGKPQSAEHFAAALREQSSVGQPRGLSIEA